MRQSGLDRPWSEYGWHPAAALEPATRAPGVLETGVNINLDGYRLGEAVAITSCALTGTSPAAARWMLARCICRSMCRLRETVSQGASEIVRYRTIVETVHGSRSRTGGRAFFAF
jgi:hypothetical protein